MVLEREMRRENEEDRDQSPDHRNVQTNDHHTMDSRTDGSGGLEQMRFLKMRLPKMIQERRNQADTSFHSERSENAEGTSTGEKSSHGGVPFLSPSGEESLSSSSSFPDRRKKKPKFQIMLEKAREEELRLRTEGKKPLFMRIQEKSLAESDRDEKEKIELSKRERSMPKKKKTSISRDVSPASAESKKKIIPIPTTKPRNNGYVPGPTRISDQELSSSDVENHGNNHSRITKKNSKKPSSKQPLFQRLAAQAKIEAEREAKDKLDKYNMIRLQKQAAKAPTREELKERERFLEAEMERNRDQKNKKQFYHGESDIPSGEKHRAARRSLSQGNNPPLFPHDNIKSHQSPDPFHTIHKESKESIGSVDPKKIRSGIPKFERKPVPIDYNNRQVTYHDDATPLHPKGQSLEQILQQHGTSSSKSSSVSRNAHPAILASMDETGGLFSPISMTSMGGDSRYSSGNSKRNKGKIGNGNSILQGTHLTDLCVDDDDSRIHATVAPTTTKSNEMRSPKKDDHMFSHKKKMMKHSAEKKDAPDSGSENESKRSMFPSPDPNHVPIVGEQYIADVLGTEEGEKISLYCIPMNPHPHQPYR